MDIIQGVQAKVSLLTPKMKRELPQHNRARHSRSGAAQN
jgi:hypothetical protein